MARKLLVFFIMCLCLGLLLTISWSKADLLKTSAWHVPLDRAKTKAQNEYDVIVVGGGFGGLSSGALLSKNGYKVLVLEKNSTVGGLCTSYESHGYRFCYGAEDIEGLGERGSVRFLLNQLGLDPSTLFVQNTHTFLDGARAIQFDGTKNSIEQALIRTFPKAETAITAFFDKAKRVYFEAYDPEMVQQWGIIVPQELRESVMPVKWTKDYKARHPNLIEWDNKSYQEVLDQYFSNSEIKTLLCGFVPYLGALPYNTPASFVIIHTFGYFFSGGYQALGTPERFAEVLASYIKDKGGQILCNHQVDRILVEKKGVAGVRVGTEEFHAPVVICDVNVGTAYFDLIGAEDLPTDFLKQLSNLPYGNSAFLLHLAVDNDLSSYTSLIQDRYNRTYASIPTKNDPSLAPKGKSTVILRETVRFSSFIHNTKEEEEQYIKDRTAELLARGRTMIPELAKGVSIIKVVTPNTYAKLVNAPHGVVYGFDLAQSSNILYFRSPIPGLYVANGSSGHPGIDGVISLGILCSHDIKGWNKELHPKE
jgi:phytoene dehydrogenase-like protein